MEKTYTLSTIFNLLHRQKFFDFYNGPFEDCIGNLSEQQFPAQFQADVKYQLESMLDKEKSTTW